MAFAASSDSVSSADIISHEFDVYVSFRGEDTRQSFVSHLYDALHRKKILVFLNESLDSGDEISSSLVRAIEKSRISLVVLSENYASSRWCLDELVHILNCREKFGQIVIPIYHHIEPSYVLRQKGPYATAFAALEQRFDDNKVQQWRDALRTVANISGWDSRSIGSESKLVATIVEGILRRLNSLVSTQDYTHLVGIEKHIEKIRSLLCLESPGVRIVGIWGMLGIGKTELARVVFTRLIRQFEGGYFLENVNESVMKHGSTHLKQELFAGLLEEEKVDLLRQGFVIERLRRAKVLVVLDAVSDYKILYDLVGDHVTSLGAGSRMIVTTRDIKVLKLCKVDAIYQVKGLAYKEALVLFSSCAFRSNSIPEDYVKLSERVISFAEGNPLFLKQLGNYLYEQISTEIRDNDQLTDSKRLESQYAGKSHELIESKLLLDWFFTNLSVEEQQMFLYVACFYKGEDVNFVEKILDDCGVSANKGSIKILIETSVIAIRNGKIHMDDIKQSMGLEIIRKACIKEIGSLNRLWNAEDANRIMETETVRANKSSVIYLFKN